MKRLLLFAMLLMGASVFAQYEDEIKLLNYACETPIEDLESVFVGYDVEVNQGVYLFADDENDNYYVVEFIDGYNVASYVEAFNRANFRAMRRCVKNASRDYYYLVCAIKEDDNILITSTKK